jgi:hypothetical protein
LRGGLAQVDAGFAAGFFFAETLADQVLLVGIEGGAEFFFNIAMAARHYGMPEFAKSGEEPGVIHSAAPPRV